MGARRNKVFTLFVLVFLVLNSVGCSTVNFKIAAAEVQRETPQSMDRSLLDQQVAANNDFAFDLYRTLRSEDGNLFFSPYSISMAVAVASAGARGETGEQINATLHYVLPPGQLHPVFNVLDHSLNTPEKDEPSFQLNVVSSLWGQDQFPFLPDFLALIARNYGAGIRLVDFKSDANRETARRTINDWVSQQTNQKIKDLLPQAMLNDLTRLILVNAIYFKGEWQDPFENGTRDALFTLPGGQQVNVPMMSRRAHAPYFRGDGFQAVALPYKGDRVEMIVVLPEPGSFSGFEQHLDRATFEHILAGLKAYDAKLYLPRFHFEYSQDMKGILEEMGMPAAFDPDQADFSGIYDQKIEPRNLFISHIAHKAFVSVDEKGTEAAAATGLVWEQVSMPVTLRVDRPFIFAIRDRQSGSILFVGRVLDPRTS